MTKEPATLAQLPRSAEAYYEESTAPGLFTYEQIGIDSAGRRIYQKYLGDKQYGEPRALLTYREYSTRVKEWAKLSTCMGVQRWTQPV